MTEDGEPLTELGAHAHTARKLLDSPIWVPTRAIWSRLTSHLETALELASKREADGLTYPASDRALVFAARAHTGQRRKYTLEPYIVHPIAVAELVRAAGGDENMIAAAYLHDVVEDTGAPLIDIETEFGSMVADYVGHLTSPTSHLKVNRATRKAMDRDHIRRAQPAVKTIKIADIIDNTATLAARDPEFWKVYRFEKLSQLEVLTEGDQTLWRRAVDQCA